MMARLEAKRAAVAARQLLDKPEARVVTRARVLLAGIAETNDELERQTRHDRAPALLLAALLFGGRSLLLLLLLAFALAFGCGGCRTGSGRRRAFGARHRSGSGGHFGGNRLGLCRTRAMDRDNGRIALMSELRNQHAFGQRDIGQEQRGR